jgi:hypothetical protein
VDHLVGNAAVERLVRADACTLACACFRELVQLKMGLIE